MSRGSLRLVLVIFLGLVAGGAAGQDVESFWSGIRDRVGEGDVVRVSGSLGASAALNAFASSAGATRRNAPFTWGANASLNFDVLGVQAPFSLAVASRNTRYNLPSYSFAGLSPTYRWITLHAGDRAMSFSPYSLSGIGFRGGGVELRPGRWHVMAMGGRLRAERAADVTSIQSGIALRGSREAYGAKVGYGAEGGSSIAASVFSSGDEVTGVPPDSLGVGDPPERNVVLTLEGSVRVGPAVSLTAEVARSAFTRDRRSPALDDTGVAVDLGGLLQARTTTQAASAGKVGVTFAPGFGQFGLTYERIGAEYRTHGSLFLLGDVENATASLAVPLFSDVLTVNATGGVQRNDLDGDQAAALRRLIGSLALTLTPSERLTASASVSNLSTTNRYKAQTLLAGSPDSLVLAQAQLSADASLTLTLDEARAHGLTVQGSVQRADLIRDGQVDPAQQSTFGLASATYAYAPEGAAGSASAALVYNRTETSDAVVTTLGPSVNYSRTLLAERARLSLAATYGLNRAETTVPADDPNAPAAGPTEAHTLRLNLGASYALGERQSLGLAGSLLRVGTTQQRPGFVDTQLGLTYGLSF